MLIVDLSPQKAAELSGAEFRCRSLHCSQISQDLAFVDNQGRILEIRSMKPFDETPIWSVSNAVAYALEVNEGWFDRHGIRTGTRIFGIPSLSGKPERCANRADLYSRIQARNEVRSGSFWTK